MTTRFKRTSWRDEDHQQLIDLVSEMMESEEKGLTAAIKEAARIMGRSPSSCQFQYQVKIKPFISESFKEMVDTNNGHTGIAHKKRLIRKIELYDEQIKRLQTQKLHAIEMLIHRGWS